MPATLTHGKQPGLPLCGMSLKVSGSETTGEGTAFQTNCHARPRIPPVLLLNPPNSTRRTCSGAVCTQSFLKVPLIGPQLCHVIEMPVAPGTHVGLPTWEAAGLIAANAATTHSSNFMMLEVDRVRTQLEGDTRRALIEGLYVEPIPK